MVSTTTTIKSAAGVVVFFAILYQVYVKDILSVSFGLGRDIRPIEEFPYNCRQVRHPRLEACEDMWLDGQARILYAACGSCASRANWTPA